MRKTKSLRAAIAAAVPELRDDPDRLKVWIENGTGQSRQTGTLAFAFSYRLNVLIEELRTDIALVALAVFRWLQVEQPELLAPGATGFTFDADVLDNETSDVVFQLDLSENVTVQPLEAGGYTLEYLAEPDPMFPDLLGAGDTDPIPDLAEVLIDPVVPE